MLSANANAVPEWTEWVDASSTGATASFSQGPSAMLSMGTSLLSSVKAADSVFTAAPDIPGASVGGHPSYALVSTGDSNADDILLTLDLTGFPIDPGTVFGFADMFFDYRIELLDAALNPVSVDDLILSHFNLFYPGGIADYDLQLASSGALTLNPVHDANQGSTYPHSGLTLFENLPENTRFVRLVSNATQSSEGIQIYFGANPIPEPATFTLTVGAMAVLFVLRSRRP